MTKHWFILLRFERKHSSMKKQVYGVAVGVTVVVLVVVVLVHENLSTKAIKRVETA